MNRRTFLASLGALGAPSLFFESGLAETLPRDIKITRIVGFDLITQRPKLVGKNSRLGVHGDQARDRMIRLYTNAGLEGLGNCRVSEAVVAEWLNQPLASLFDLETARVKASGLGSQTMPLWDLAGKALQRPVYELLGGRDNRKVAAYDGSIYFSDLLPNYEDRFIDRFKEEIDMGLERGHRTFKIKIGRGHKWMEPEAGYRRDITVLKGIRGHAGPDIGLAVDANNGYTLEQTKRLLETLPDFNFLFMEEMFPEEVEACLALKAFIKEHGWKTLVADGETQGDLEAYKPLINAQAVDILQGDMNRFGIEGIRKEAAWAAPAGIQVAPHNWGSLIGFYLQLHVAKALPNFYKAEHDALSSPVLTADGYNIQDGMVSVPEAPGFGLAIHEQTFAREAKIRFDLTI